MACKIRKASLRNCFQHEKLDVEFSDFTVIVGANGSGKSNLLESIMYCLGIRFGLPGTKETMITNGADSGKVELILEQGGEEVKLGARLGAANRSLKRGDKSIKAAADVLEYIENALFGGTPLDMVTQASIIRQGALEDGLFDTRAKVLTAFSRMAGLADIETKRKQLADEKDRLIVPMVGLRIEELEEAIRSNEEAAKQHLKVASEKLALIDDAKLSKANKRVLHVEGVLATSKKYEEVRGKLEEAQEELEKIRHSRKAVAAEYDTLKQVIDESKDHVEAAREAVASYTRAQEDYAKYQSLQTRLEAARASIAGLVDPGKFDAGVLAEYRLILSDTKALQSAAERVVKGLSAREAGANACPTCLQELSDERAEALKAAKQAEIQEYCEVIAEAEKGIEHEEAMQAEHQQKVETYTQTLQKAESTIEHLTAELETITVREEPKPVDDQRELIDLFTTASADMENVREKLTKIDSGITRLEERVSTLSEQEAELRGEALDAENIEDGLDEDRAYIKMCEAASAEAHAAAGAAEAVTQQVETDKARLEKTRKEKEHADKANDVIRYLEYARTALHRDNFPSGKIKAFINKMLSSANMYLEVMQAKFSVSYDTETGFTAFFPAGAKLDRPLEIRADRLSGGERCIFALAARFSINDLRTDTGFMILDEPTAPLDDAHVEKVVDALQLVKSKLSSRVQVIVPTHDERLMAVGDSVIRLGGQ